MDTPYKNSLLCLAMVLMANLTLAQEKVSKTISETFEMTNAGELQVDNKYGNITIHGWSKNNISITVDIVTSHKKMENAQQNASSWSRHGLNCVMVPARRRVNSKYLKMHTDGRKGGSRE